MSHHSIKRGIHCFRRGDLDGAEKTLQTLLQSSPRHAQGWCLLGLVRQARGERDEALDHYRKAARLDPRYADPHNNIGWLYNLLGKPEEAIDCLRKALRLRPEFPEAHNNLGNAYLLLKQEQDALACFREAVRQRPDFAEALNNIAMVLIARGQQDEAVALLERALRARPEYADALVNLSWAYLEKGEWQRCAGAASQALRLNPDSPAVHNNLGNALLGLGRAQEAAEQFLAALRLRPDFSQALENLGLALIRLGRPEEAVGSLARAARLDPSRPGVLNNLAFALTAQGRWEDAVKAACAALKRRPEFPEAYNNLGLSCIHLRQPEPARAALEHAVRLKPEFADAQNNLGWALVELGQFARAVEVLRECLRLRPDFPEALNNLGLACNQLKQLDDALASYRRAVELRPDFAEALGGMGDVYGGMGWHDEAVAAYRRSIALKPDMAANYSNLLFTLHYLPDLTPEDVFREHLAWARHHAVPPAPDRPHPNSRDPERRLRVGYVSADFARHVMGWYIQPVLEAHDQERFEVFCYSNVKRPDDLSRYLEGLADHWRPIFGLSDDQAEEMIRRDGIDVLVDLSNHTGGNRLPLFARRPAPVQATHLGLQYTTGNPAIDYRITDTGCDPPGLTEPYNTEELVRLPEVSLCYRANVTVEVNELPAASSGRVTFGFFNNFAKITPRSIAAWAQILGRLPDSRLILVESPSAAANRRLLAALADLGVESGRVTMVGRQSRQDYYRMYNRVDLTLDSFPFTGCFTTCDSLWMGVALVTLEGRSSMARQGVSLLSHLGLSDLIAQTTEDYVERTVSLAQDLPRLAGLRVTLRDRMEGSTLMNKERFTRQLEEVYRWMWRRWCSSKGRQRNPDGLRVGAAC
jgi:predicted O-linked N-acetylglucosamine transferase (SPINDLY family)